MTRTWITLTDEDGTEHAFAIDGRITVNYFDPYLGAYVRPEHAGREYPTVTMTGRFTGGTEALAAFLRYGLAMADLRIRDGARQWAGLRYAIDPVGRAVVWPEPEVQP